MIEEFPHQKVNHPAHKPSSPAGPGRVEAPGVWGQTAAFPETGPHSGTHPEAAEEGNVVVAEAAVGGPLRKRSQKRGRRVGALLASRPAVLPSSVGPVQQFRNPTLSQETGELLGHAPRGELA